MQVSVTFRHMEPSDSLKAFAGERLEKVQKFVHTPADAHVVLTVANKYQHKADITISLHGMQVRGKETSEDMYASIDGAMSKIERQIKRYRNKITNHKPREGATAKVKLNYLEATKEPAPEAEATPELPPQITETKELEAKPMTVDEAVMQMDLLHNDFLVFINAKTDQMNVLYRRGDGFGLIEGK